MKRPTILIVLILCGTLAAVQAPAQTRPESDAPDKASVSQCPRVTFSSVEKPQTMGRSFSAARSADLIFRLKFHNSLDRDSVVTLKVFTPNGHLYRQYDVPVASGNEKRSQGTRSLPGYPYPVPVRELHMTKAGGRNFASVDVPFPVAGSAIVTSSLYGRWKVEVSLDGGTTMCRNKPASFHLRE